MDDRLRNLGGETEIQRFGTIVPSLAEKILRRQRKVRKRKIFRRMRRHLLRLLFQIFKKTPFQTIAERSLSHLFRKKADPVQHRFPRLIHPLFQPLREEKRFLPPVDRRRDRIRITIPSALRGIVMQKVSPFAMQKAQMPRQRPGKFRFRQFHRRLRRGRDFASEISHCR